jgi:regulation of enolase protein 1 (concanavalin A-like superfamily)
VTDTVVVPGLDLAPTPSPGSSWSIAQGILRTTAAPHSDLFVDPGGDDHVNAESLLNAVTLLADLPEGDFQFSARVTVDFVSTFDAGVLLVWFDETHWAKLCFEFSPDREPMVVSVVTRDVADDANAFVVEGPSVHLRVSRVGRVFAYHASIDGTVWRLVRAFALDGGATAPRIGFEAQAPTGEGCEVRFEGARFTRERLGDLRDGS